MYIPKALVVQLQERFHIPYFIETGTYFGNTASWASRFFDHVYTIELSNKLAAAAQRRFAGTNVTCVKADSRAALRQILAKTADQPRLFWLDAHWSSGITAGESDQCPLLDELALILERADKQPEQYIFIDDARYFMAPVPELNPAHWPSIYDVLHALRRGNSSFQAVHRDVIISVPKSAERIVVEHVRSTPRTFAERVEMLPWSLRGRLMTWSLNRKS